MVEEMIPHYIRADLDEIEGLTDEHKEAFMKLFQQMSYRNYVGRENFYRGFECLSVRADTHIRNGSRLRIPSRYISTTNDFNIILKWIVTTPPKNIPTNLLADNPFLMGMEMLHGSIVCFIRNETEVPANIIRGQDIQWHAKQPFVEDFRKESLFVDRVPHDRIMGYGFFIRISPELYERINENHRKGVRVEGCSLMVLQGIQFYFVLKCHKENKKEITDVVDYYAANFDGPVIGDGAYDWLDSD